MNTSDEDIIDCTPPTIVQAARETTLNLLPPKSKERYELTYNQFMNWRKENKIDKSFSEHILLAYVSEQSKKLSPNSLWTIYSMLKSTLSIYQNVDISQYAKLKALLKKISDGYIPKKSKTLTALQIQTFLNEAPDDVYLLSKVILITGLSGACRKYELVQLKIENIKDLGSAAVIKIPDTKTKRPRTFTITGKFYEVYKKYAGLRPSDINHNRFFLNYQHKKCTRQPVGVNKIGIIPKQIATYLRLPEPELYTGHCFRRSSATILVDAGGDITTLKRHGGWKSTAVAESYIDESLSKKIKVANTIENSVNETSSDLVNPEDINNSTKHFAK